MKAVIMAGGKGTRLQSITKEIPKPMFLVRGKPILEYQIESLRKSKVTEIIMIIGHLGTVIREYFKEGSKWNVSIEYIMEDQPLGTAGALYYIRDKIKEDFLLLFGDLILDVDFNRFMDFHRTHGAWITLFGHPNAHPYDSDVIVVDKNSKVTGMESKSIKRDLNYHNFVNAGIYCINPKILASLERPERLDLENKLIADHIGTGCVYAYRSTEYVKDMGTPDRLYAVSEDICSGVVESRSLKNRQKAIFLDRDGTINVHNGFINSPDQFELLPNISEAVRKINTSCYLTILATNQPVIARGECTFDGLDEIHKKMETELGKLGAYIDDIFFCPHHPHMGYAGEVPELKTDCDCRKPKTGMLKQAAEKYNIDLSQSWYVGDTTIDIQTGCNAGMKTILVRTGEAGQDGKFDVKPDYAAEDLMDAVNYILS